MLWYLRKWFCGVFLVIWDHFVKSGVDLGTWEWGLRHSVMSRVKLGAILRWGGEILWWLASIWFDFGTICDDWRHVVMFGGETGRLETNKRSLEAILGHVVMNLWPNRTSKRSFEWNSGGWRRPGAVCRRFAMIEVEFVATGDDWSRCVVLQGDSGQFGTSWRRFLVIWAKSGTIWGKWRHSVMSLGRFVTFLRRFVEVAASSGPFVLILRRIEALQWNRIEFRRIIGCQFRWIGGSGTINKKYKWFGEWEKGILFI